jgi:hypothetical protein
MFDQTSRYAKLEITEISVPDANGELRVVRYVTRRLIPVAGSSDTLVEHTVAAGERLDRIAARYVGDPAQFWRIADANASLRSEESTDRPGAVLRIALPQP